jgi:hypothetical protein
VPLIFFKQLDLLVNFKDKFHPRTSHESPDGGRGTYIPTLSLTSALDGVGWSVPRPGRFTPENETGHPL